MQEATFVFLRDGSLAYGQASACLRYAIQPDSGRKCEQWVEECCQQVSTDQCGCWPASGITAEGEIV